MGKEHGVWKSDFDPAKKFTTKRFKNSDTVLRSDLFGNPVPPKRTSASGLEPSASPYKLEIEADIVEVDYGIGIGRPEELPWRITLAGTKPIDSSPGSARPLVIAHGLGENHIFDEAAKRGDALELSFIDYWRDMEGHDDDELKEEEKYDGEEGSIASSEFLTASEHASEADSESAYESPSDFEDDDATHKLAIEVGDLDLYGMNANSQRPWAIELEGTSRFSAECTKVPASSSHHVAGDAAIPVPDDEQNDSVWEPTKFLYCDFDFTFQPALVPEQLRPKSFNATPTFFGIRQRADAKPSQICFTFTPAVNRPRSFSKNPALPGIQQDGPLWERAYIDASQTLFTFHPPTVVTPLRKKALHFSGDADLIKYAKAHPGKIYDRLLAGLQPGKYDQVENPFEVRSPRSWKVPLVLPESGKSRELTVMVSSDSRNLVARGIARELGPVRLRTLSRPASLKTYEIMQRLWTRNSVCRSMKFFRSLAPPKSSVTVTPWKPGPRPTPFNPFYRPDMTLEVAASNILAYLHEAGDWLVHWETSATILDMREGARDPKSKLGQILWHIASTLEFLRIGRQDWILTQFPDWLFRDVDPLLPKVLKSLAVYRNWHGCEMCMWKAERAVEEIAEKLKAIEAAKKEQETAGSA